jgi:HEPN domain-containing protein
MKPETQEWLNIADQDLAAATVLVEEHLFAPAIFHCQQAVEKYLKALWVEQHTEGIPPRIHDLTDLLTELDLDLPDWQMFLERLSRQAVESRYVGPANFPSQMAVEILQGTNELCVLLRLRLK